MRQKLKLFGSLQIKTNECSQKYHNNTNLNFSNFKCIFTVYNKFSDPISICLFIWKVLKDQCKKLEVGLCIIKDVRRKRSPWDAVLKGLKSILKVLFDSYSWEFIWIIRRSFQRYLESVFLVVSLRSKFWG
jgi:hypothetical protein